MPNTTFQIRSNFDNLYFHAKYQVKSKKYHKIKCDVIKKLLSWRIQIRCLETNLTTYTSMQNFRSKGNNKNHVQYFIEKIRSCRVQNWRLGGNLRGYTFMQNLRIKYKIPQNYVGYIIEKLWSCQIQNFILGAILIMYTFIQNLWLKAQNTIKSSKIHH